MKPAGRPKKINFTRVARVKMPGGARHGVHTCNFSYIIGMYRRIMV
jgi:hypothetical protein